MTFEQIFYRFCKKENIYSEVSERLKQLCIKRERLLQVGPKGYITPRELIFSLIAHLLKFNTFVFVFTNIYFFLLKYLVKYMLG